MQIPKYLRILFLFMLVLPYAHIVASENSLGHLKNPVSIQYHQYQAAKHMCLYTVHSNKEKLKGYQAARLVLQCSKGKFQHVMHKLGGSVEKGLKSFTDEDGEQLLAEWEIIARKGQKHLNILDAAAENKK